jgi:hypothetical protein
MIPGISSVMEERLVAVLDPRVTDITPAAFADRDFTLLGGFEAEARDLGIEASGPVEPTIVITDRARRLGHVRVECAGRNATLFFDNRNWGGNCHAHIRILGDDSVLLFNEIGDHYVALPDIFLRSEGQFVFWGRMASAVGCNMEVEGSGQGVVIGDDALISGGVWIRNYDMHSMHETKSGKRISREPVNTVLERHVWLGQDAMLLCCERIGMGSILGARALLKGSLPRHVVAAGTPARVLREGVSWGRETYAMSEAERLSIGLPAQPLS